METNKASTKKRLVLFACLLVITLVVLSSLWNYKSIPKMALHDNGLTNSTLKHKNNTLKPSYLTDLSFSVSFGDPVAMHIDDSTHYDLDSELGSQEYANLIPPSGHVVHIGDINKPDTYTVSLFHQLKCLDIVRQQYIAPSYLPISALTSHCMNYLRQSVLCRLNLRLESTKDAKGTTSRGYEAVCRDWTKMYDEAERNYKQYSDLNFDGRESGV